MKLCWVTLRIGDVAASLHFYHDILGLPIGMRHTVAGSDMIMLGTANDPKVELLYTENTVPAPGNGISIGLSVDSLQDMLERMADNGIPILSGPISPGPGIAFFFVADPDGYAVQFVEQTQR